MQRLSNPGKRLPDRAGEPNFYAISKKYPLPELSLESHGPHSSPMSSHPPPGMLHPYAFPPHTSAQYGMMYGGYHGMSPPGGMPPPSPTTLAGRGQLAPNYPPNPYGFYPYPHMMMGPPPQAMGTGGPNHYQGYYFPYQQPQFLPSPSAASSSNVAAAMYYGVAEENSEKEEKKAVEKTDETNGEKSEYGKKVEDVEDAAIKEEEEETVAV